jgi:hypothetical protein
MSKKSLKRTRRSSPGSRVEGFHLFPKLPAEIKLKIWKLSLPGPRAITIRPGKHSYITTNIVGGILPNPNVYDVYNDKAVTKTPALLQVNRESREVALKSYRPIFRCQPNDSIVYFDFAIDYLQLPTHSSLVHFFQSHYNSNLRADEFHTIYDRVQHLIYDMSSSPTMLIADFGHLYEMSNLKTLVPWDGVKVSGNDRGTLYAYKSTIETNFKKS